jgi:uncharacterized membrane protein YfhO
MQKLIHSPGLRFAYLLALLICGLPRDALATMDVLGEYSYLHVSFSSIWHIFLFILVLVMMPFFLMIFASWHRINEIKEEKAMGESDDGLPKEEGRE